VTRKVALVIGNSSYRELPTVKAASDDAYDVAEALRSLRFDEVELKTDVTAQDMARVFDDFSRIVVQKGDLAVVYFSGQGGQAGGESYLLPVDYSPPSDDASVEARGAVRISQIRDLLNGGAARVRLMIFDACRGALITTSPSVEVGLRAIKSTADGTFIAYSAPPGGIAPLDQERHSFYTAELLSFLRSPDRDLKASLEEAQLRVYRLTKERQIPYLQGFLETPLYLGYVPDPKAGEEEELSWASADKSDTPAAYQSYLRQYPKGVFVDIARMKLATQQEKPGVSPGTTKLNPKDDEEYVWVPPGNFMLTCGNNEELCQEAEKPSVRVTFSRGFWIGMTEVTVGAWKRYRKATGAAALPTQDPDGRSKLNEASGNDLMPAIGMTRDDARSFCGWIGGRLPKEEEWEYAARAGAGGLYYGGLDSTAWFASNSGRRRLNTVQVKNLTPGLYDAELFGNGDGPHPVAQKEPNAWRLYDVLGNVWEWSEPRVPKTNLGWLRGGAWSTLEGDTVLTRRTRVAPEVQLHDIGLRCTWDAH
jgi:formylglycine-generating enzyme required for sulfatase activity